MHESSIVDSLLSSVLEYVKPGERVRRIDVRVGVLSGVSPGAMQFYFEILREGTAAAEAELHISMEPLHVRCQTCGGTSDLPEIELECPVCGKPSLEYMNGDELDIVSLEVDDGVGHHY